MVASTEQMPDPSLPIELKAKEATEKSNPKSLWRETLENLLRNPSAIVGLVILTLLVLIAIFAPTLATHDPEAVLFDIPEEGANPRLKPCIHALGCPKAGEDLVRHSTPLPIVDADLNRNAELGLVVNGNDILVWNIRDDKELVTLSYNQPLTAAAWSANEQFILSATTNELQLWDFNKKQITRTLPIDFPVEYIRWNADGLRFFVGNNRQVAIWDATLWNKVGTLEFEDELLAAQWNQNGTLVMTASGNKVQIWNAFTATQSGLMEHEQPLTGASYNTTTTRILTSSGNQLFIWNSASYEQEMVIEHDSPLANAAWNENVSEGVKRVVANSGDTAFVWDSSTGKLLHTLPHGEPITTIQGSPFATRILVGGDSKITIWDAETGEEVAGESLSSPAHTLEWMSTGAGFMMTEGDSLRLVKTSNFQYLMGTDGNVRDEFSRVLYGARISLYIGFATVTFAIVIGTILGCLAGFWGGWTDNVIMRILDVLLAFPALILAIAIITVLGPGLINALIALAIVSIPAYARVARAGVLSVKELEFVAADRVLGVSQMRILFRRILPNILAPLIVQGTLGIGGAILEAAALSFIGLGAQPPTPEWGAMLASERNQLFTAPHLVIIPGIMIMLVVLSFNLLGDGLRDALDPRLNR
jgi:peptide/nickel transport system permease protein